MINNTTANIASASSLEFVNRFNLRGNTPTKTGNGTMLVNNSFNTGGTIVGLEGTISGAGTVGGDVDNQGGIISPGSNAIGDGEAAQVPEPSAYLLLRFGVGVLAWACRKQRKL